MKLKDLSKNEMLSMVLNYMGHVGLDTEFSCCCCCTEKNEKDLYYECESCQRVDALEDLETYGIKILDEVYESVKTMTEEEYNKLYESIKSQVKE